MSRLELSHNAKLIWWLWREKIINSLRFNGFKTWHYHICAGVSSDFLGLLVLVMIVCGVGVAAVVQSINACHRTSRVLETDLIALKLVCDEQLWDSNHFETHRAAWYTCCDRHQLVSSSFAFILRGALRQSLRLAVIQEWYNSLINDFQTSPPTFCHRWKSLGWTVYVAYASEWGEKMMNSYEENGEYILALGLSLPLLLRSRIH